MQGQNSTDAIQQNLPLLSENNIGDPAFPYPASLPALDTGKTYVWQVVANSNGIPAAASEIWTFRIKVFNTDNTAQTPQPPYIRLSTETPSGYFVCDGILKFEYINEINDSIVSIRVNDISGEESQPVHLDNEYVLLQFGQNLLDIDLGDSNAFIRDHLYSLEIINSKQEVWKGKFKYKPTN